VHHTGAQAGVLLGCHAWGACIEGVVGGQCVAQGRSDRSGVVNLIHALLPYVP
jgi:hypothetical protein